MITVPLTPGEVYAIAGAWTLISVTKAWLAYRRAALPPKPRQPKAGAE